MLWYIPVLASVLRLVFQISGKSSCIHFLQSYILLTSEFNRGPKGVWTLERKGEKPNINISFNDAVPTKTHMALVKLVEEGK